MTVSAQAEPVASLFCSPEDRAEGDKFLAAIIDDALRAVGQRRVSPVVDIEHFQGLLEGFDFRTPRPLSDLLPWVVEQLATGIVHLTHPRYFGLFNPAPSYPAECAERIVAAFNPQLATSTTSPIPVEIEAHVIRSIGRRVGFSGAATGHFTSGGTEANFTALICALTQANPDFATDGVTAFAGKPTVYVSEDAHLAWHKIAHQAGIGRSAVRLVDTDRHGRMDQRALSTAIATDRVQGRHPVLVVGTAGTTGAGMIDPLADCADIARAACAWFHIDAAWGGALIASDRMRGRLTGIETADSVTIDAHKWLATTMGCGMFITPHHGILPDCFHVSTSYMPSNIPDRDPYVLTIQWSRRFIGLQLFVSLAAAGWQGYAAHLERAIDLAQMLQRKLLTCGWTIANESPLAVVCAEPPPGFPDVRSIARQVVASGLAWVSTTVFRKRYVLRMCITNGRTMPQDIEALVCLLESFRPTLPE